jgi:hypothetical protein
VLREIKAAASKWETGKILTGVMLECFGRVGE